MFCSACGTQLDQAHSFCYRCGRPTNPERMSPWGVPKTLSRPLWDKKIGGVCAGFARYLDVDVTLMRIIWLVTAIFTGIGFVAYLIAWIAMPAEAKLTMPSAPLGPKSAPQEPASNPPDGALGQSF